MSYINILLPWLEQPDLPAVERIVRALFQDEATRAAIAAEADAAAVARGTFVSLSQLLGGPPPRGLPFLNEALGVLTVPAPPGGVAAVQAAIGAVMPPGTRLEEATTLEAQQGES